MIQSGGRRRKQTDAPEWTPEEEAFFDRFLRICEARGIGPWRLAQLLEASPGTVHPWFARRAMPGGKYMIRLPKILGVDGHWLLTGKGRP